MKRVKRGHGIKLFDEELETAAFKILTSVYSHLVSIENPHDLDEVLFVFQTYIFKEYERLYSFLKKLASNSDTCDYIEGRLKRINTSIDKKPFMAPTEILGDLYKIKNIKKLIQVQEVSVSCCLKLK